MVNTCRVSVMVSRSEQRRQTERRIAATAGALFAELGFERTTVRAVAARAGVDPALVMQYFGSKQGLFRAVVTMDHAPAGEPPEEMVERILAALGVKIGQLPQASLAMMRSMLTHPEAGRDTRAILDRQVEQIAAAIPAPDAHLRAGLVIATMLGVTIARGLLNLDALRDGTPEQIIELLRPGFEALATTAREPAS